MILVTGSGGLIGSAASKHFLKCNDVVGIDNNTRMELFGPGGDVSDVISELKASKRYRHCNIDIRNRENVFSTVRRFKPDVIIHAAAQPSHDRAASIPCDDFEINALGTLNVLEAARQYAPNSVVLFVSTNKVYGDSPNTIELVENEKRFDYADGRLGICENQQIDNCMHSIFGASKVSADIMCQEYGKYYGLKTGIFRGGCLTGPQHAGVQLHGYLSYIVKCAVLKKPYVIFGYKGKQVRDQIHCDDVISIFEQFISSPKVGEVYNIGGCKENSISIIETIDILKSLGHDLITSYVETSRKGDHICYYTDMSKFKSHFPTWKMQYSVSDTINEIVEHFKCQQ